MFIDTNVLINAININSDHSAAARRSLLAIRKAATQTYISGQVLREYFSAVTRPGTANGIGMSPAQAVAALPGLLDGTSYLDDVAEVRAELHRLFFDRNVKGKQIHDANIVATMLAHRERELITFNAGDFIRYADLIDIIEP